MKIQKLFVGLIVLGVMILSSVSSSFAADKMRGATTPLLADFVRRLQERTRKLIPASAKENMHS
jgi:hypothetical protein